MNDDEYRLMHEVEGSHWWYRGLRDLIARVLIAQGLHQRSGLNVLDAGCGTGENLRLLQGLLSPSYLGGFDLSPLAIELCRRKLPDADLYVADLRNPELHRDSYDLILSCDVLSMTGLEAARDGLRTLAGRLRPGGLLLLNLPAFKWLHSAHDVAIGTQERFTASALARFLHDLKLDVSLLTYRLCLLLPAIVVARLPSMLSSRRRSSGVRSDLSRPWLLANDGLTAALRCENALISRGIRLPWGSSVFAVGRRN